MKYCIEKNSLKIICQKRRSKHSGQGTAPTVYGNISKNGNIQYVKFPNLLWFGKKKRTHPK